MLTFIITLYATVAVICKKNVFVFISTGIC